MEDLERLWIEGFAKRAAAIMKNSSKPRVVLRHIVDEFLTATVGFYGPSFPWEDIEEALDFLQEGPNELVKGEGQPDEARGFHSRCRLKGLRGETAVDCPPGRMKLNFGLHRI
jgi:hypothetical protein